MISNVLRNFGSKCTYPNFQFFFLSQDLIDIFDQKRMCGNKSNVTFMLSYFAIYFHTYPSSFFIVLSAHLLHMSLSLVLFLSTQWTMAHLSWSARVDFFIFGAHTERFEAMTKSAADFLFLSSQLVQLAQ